MIKVGAHLRYNKDNRLPAYKALYKVAARVIRVLQEVHYEDPCADDFERESVEDLTPSEVDVLRCSDKLADALKHAINEKQVD